MSHDPIVIVSAARTPMGAFQGDFSSLAAHDLGGAAIKAAVERAGIEPDRIDDAVIGAPYVDADLPTNTVAAIETPVEAAVEIADLIENTDYLMFLDSDDLLERSVMQEIAAIWRPGLSKVQFRLRVVDGAARPLGSTFPQFHGAPQPDELRRWAAATTTYPTPPGSGNRAAGIGVQFSSQDNGETQRKIETFLAGVNLERPTHTM